MALENPQGASPASPGLQLLAAPAAAPQQRGGTRRDAVRRGAAMAGALEPYLDSLRRELQAPGPAAFSVLLALLLVALTLRESRGRCGGVRGGAGRGEAPGV